MTNPPVTASNAIMIAPPMNSAAANCQPMRTMSTMPSSITRFVDANMKIIALTKSAPFWNSDFAIAVAAYEQLDDTMPKPVARATGLAPWAPRARRISSRETNACTAPESVNPRINAHSVSQNMKNASRTLSPISAASNAASTCIIASARASRANETRDRRRRLRDLLLRSRAALGERVGDAMAEMFVEQLDGDGLERLGHGRDLGQD